MEEVFNGDDFTLLIVGDDTVKDNMLIPNISEILNESENMSVLLEAEVKQEDIIDFKEENGYYECLENSKVILSNRKEEGHNGPKTMPLLSESEIKLEESDTKEDTEVYEEYELLEDYEVDEQVNVRDEIDKTSNADSYCTNTKNIKEPKLAPEPISEVRIPISYIQQLHSENPELVSSEVKLIDHLVDMMRATKPPDAPRNFCEIEGVGDCEVYVCCICKAKSRTLAIAGRHYQWRHGENYLMCYACGRTYRLTSSLYKHEKTCTAPFAQLVLKARGQYLGVKGKSRPFSTSNKFKPSNSEPKRFYCSQCTSSFSLKINMLAHELTHSGRRPFRCDKCTAAYTSEFALKRHQKIHEDHSYICDHCGHSAKIRSAFVTHMNVHLPLPKYACQYCPRRFAQNLALKHHVNIKHLNLPPAHACPVCSRRFARLSLVKNHMKKTHGLDLITKNMFFKMLPNLDEMEVQNAKIVLKSEVNKNDVNNKIQEYAADLTKKEVTLLDQGKSIPEKKVITYSSFTIEKENEKLIEVHIPEDDDPEENDNFLRLIHMQVKSGCKVITVPSKNKTNSASIESDLKLC